MSDVRCTFCDEINPPTQRNCRSCGAELPGAQSLISAETQGDVLAQEVVQIASEAGMIEAIKHYREQTGAGLAEAKSAVEAIVYASLPGEPLTASTSEQEILSIVRKRGKIAAIKRYREINGCGLKEAKEAVEAMMARSGTVAGKSSAGCGSYVLALFLVGLGISLWMAGRF